MYIAGKYWDNYIGDTDDSLTFTSYLAGKKKEEITLKEIFSDTGLDKLNGDFTEHEEPLVVTDDEGWEIEFYYAIDLITDLAALLLECKVNGKVDLHELNEFDCEPGSVVCITATPEEHEMMNKALKDFVADPLSYDIAEMCGEEDMMATAEICEALRKELYG